jgi:hypothetical protein
LVLGGVAWALASGDDESATLGAAPSASATPSPSAPTIPKPTAVRAKAGAGAVVLTWKAPKGVTILIARDGVAMARVEPSAAPRYVDHTVVPLRTYRYTLEAIDGAIRSGPVAVQVETKEPPITAARLEGIFDVTLRKTSSYGATGLDDKLTAGWSFRPACVSGPCDVRLADIGWKAIRIDLARDGGAYSGSASVKGFLQCSGTPTTSSYKVTLHLTEAEVIRDEWVATAFEGTVTVYDGPQLGCRSSNITYAIEGSLVER